MMRERSTRVSCGGRGPRYKTLTPSPLAGFPVPNVQGYREAKSALLANGCEDTGHFLAL